MQVPHSCPRLLALAKRSRLSEIPSCPCEGSRQACAQGRTQQGRPSLGRVLARGPIGLRDRGAVLWALLPRLAQSRRAPAPKDTA